MSEYEKGRQHAWMTIFSECLRNIGSQHADKNGWLLERAQTVAALRTICAEHGDNDWPDGLHLADVIEKHLARYYE